MLTVFTGPMKCGKTTQLINKYTELSNEGKKCMMFKPIIDNRFSNIEVVSRDGESVTAINIKTIYDLIPYKDLVDFFFIDEFQFIEGQDVYVIINSFIDSGKVFYVAGLNLTAERKPFGNMPQILALADNIECMEAKCDICGKYNAIYSYCKEDKNKDILVGDTQYLSLCKDCYNTTKKNTL